MAFTTSPNMSLIIPGVGTEFGPAYADDVNNSLTLIDQHDHTPGRGVPITPFGMNITTDLSFNNFSPTSVASVVFNPQPSLLTLTSVYVRGVDLYYRDGNDNEIQLTINGNPNSGNGNITGLPSGTAGVNYSAGTFTFSSATNTPANIQGGSVLLGNIVANSKYLTLSPPAAMASNFTLTLPTIPSGNSFLLIDSSGNITPGALVDNSSIQFTSNVLSVKPGGITAAMLASDALTWNVSTITASGNFTVPTGVNILILEACGAGGGGGGSGGLSAAVGTSGGGAGGQGAQPMEIAAIVTPGEVVAIVIGAAGTAGTAGGGGSSHSAGGTGGTGGNTTVATAARTYTFVGGNGGAGGADNTGSTSAGGARNTPIAGPWLYAYGGGGGSGSANNAEAGQISAYFSTAAARGLSNGGAGTAAGGGGGGGGGAGIASGGAGGNGANGSNANFQVGFSAAANSGGGGGGGGGRATSGGGSVGTAGGAGGSGVVNIYWLGPA